MRRLSIFSFFVIVSPVVCQASVSFESELADVDDKVVDATCKESSSHLSLLQRSAHIAAKASVHSQRNSAIKGVDRRAALAYDSFALSGGAESCVYYEPNGNAEYEPFNYYYSNATAKAPFIQPVTSPSGLCLFLGASCSVGKCCGLSKTANSQYNSASNWSTILCLVVLIPAIVYMNRQGNQPQPEGQQTLEPSREEAIAQASPAMQSALNVSPWQRFFNTVAISVGICAVVYVGIIMADSTQTTLSVLERNSMLASDAWLTPIGSVFQFLEDTMTVKITFAMATGQIRRVKALLIIGVVGGIVTGSLCAGILTGIAYTEPVIETLLVPYQTVGTGCTLIPTGSEIVRGARGYWLLNSWAFPFNFVTLVLTGFILGSLEFGLYGLAMGVSQLLLAAIWFGLKPADGASPGLTLLGWANFWSSVSFVVVCFVGMVSKPDLREKYNLYFFSDEDKVGKKVVSKDAEEEEESFSDMLASIGREAASQGGEAMCLDLCVQLDYTAGVYMSGVLGVDVLYQVSAMQSAMPMFGTAYALGLSYMIKIRGGVLVGLRQFHEFSNHLYRNTWICIYFAVVTILTTLPYRAALAFYFASPACVYASEPSCLATYSGIFGGGSFSPPIASDTPLQQSFLAFSFAAAAICLFTALKAGLYCCYDFAFMAKCGLVCLLFFIPCVCVAFFVFRNALAMYAAMYAPTLLIGVAFASRLLHNRKKMLNGEGGPWGEPVVGAIRVE